MRYDNRKAVHIWVMAFDWVAVLTGLIMSHYLCNSVLHRLTTLMEADYQQYIFIVLIGYIIAYLFVGNYDDFLGRGLAEELLSVTKNQIVLLAIISVTMILTKNNILESRYLYFMEFGFTFMLVLLFRIIIKTILRKMYASDKNANLVALIADSTHIEALLENLKGQWEYKIVGIIIVDTDMKNQEIQGIPVVANESDMMAWLRKTPLDEVIIDKEYIESVDSDNVEEMENMGITVHISIPFMKNFRNYSEKVTTINNYIALTLASSNSANYEKLFLKRMFDIFVGLVGCILSVPIILITAIPLLIESRGPLFFKQVRVGLNGRRFKIYKLRSMYPDAEQRLKDLMDKNEMDGLMFKMTDDPRITKVGKFIRATSIDELPQFLNILKGDMSFVGTRPPTENEFMQYKSHHRRRLSMKPGLTGLWQVSGRSDIKDFEEVVRLDVQYIDNWSIRNDIKIILKTVKVVLLRVGSR